jgi:hypothetical protein
MRQRWMNLITFAIAWMLPSSSVLTFIRRAIAVET